MSSSLNSDSIQGYLYKKGNKSFGLSSSSTAWKKRWFVLESGSLKYYKNPTDDSPKGSIQVHQFETIEINTSASTTTTTTSSSTQPNTNRFHFDIKTKSRIYHLYSDTDQNRDYWIINLNISIVKLADSKTTSRPRSSSTTTTNSTTTTTTTTTTTNNVLISQSPQPSIIASTQPQITTNNNTVSNKPPLPAKPQSLQQQQQQQQTTPPVQHKQSPTSSQTISESDQSHLHQQHQQHDDRNVSLCGAKHRDLLKNHSSGYITSMVAVTRAKIWCGDSQGNIVTWTISRTGSTDKLKKGSQWKEHNQTITSLVYIPSQKLVYSAGLDNKICAWNKTDYSLLFTHTTTIPIYDMISSKNDLLIYCGGGSVHTSGINISPITSALRDSTNSNGSNNSSNNGGSNNGNGNGNTLSLFDTITKDETFIPFTTFFSYNVGVKKRKFIKMVKHNEKIIIATDRCEILIWSPWETEPCRYTLALTGSFDITAINVIGDTIWVCSTQSDSNSSNIFASTLPCVVTVLDVNSLKRVKSFEATHPISQFSIVNGYIWAVTRGYISIYEYTTGQLPFESIQLKEDMNYRLLLNNNTMFVGGNYLWRFQIYDFWIRDNLEQYNTTSSSSSNGTSSPDKSSSSSSITSTMLILQPIQDYTDYDHILNVLTLIKQRLLIHHCNQLYDIILTIGENDNLSTLTEFQIQIVKIFSNFCQNKSIVMRDLILSDNNRIYRISKLLSTFLTTSKNAILVYESLKTINYLISNFEKFIKQLQPLIIETIIKQITTLSISNSKLILSMAFIILNKLLSNSDTNQLSNANSIILKEKVKSLLSLFFDPLMTDDSSRIAIINIISRFSNELREQFKKESILLQIYEFLKGDIGQSSLASTDLVSIVYLILKDSPKIKEMANKNNSISGLIPLIENHSGAGGVSTIERIRFYQIMTNPTFIQKSLINGIGKSGGGKLNSSNGSGGSSGNNRKLIVSTNFQSPVESILFTLNSILHSLKSTSFKNIKITILDISIPNEFPQDFLSSINGSIMNINFILPSKSFVSTIKFKFHPKDLSIKIAFEKGLSIGETTISNFSITGDLQLGFEIGTAKPEYITFLEEPEILFDINSSGLVLNIVDLFVKSIVKKTIKRKFVSPNRFYLPG